MKRLLHILAAALLAQWLAGPSQAHEVRPAYLEITERADGHAEILWKQPSVGVMVVALRPHIEGGLLDRQPDQVRSADSFSLAKWRNLDLRGKGIGNRTIYIEGLDRTITDVLVVVHLASGDTLQRILTPATPRFVVDTHAGAAVPTYLLLGIGHILSGIDHLLFVFGLILLCSTVGSLLATITAFTIAHSITLILTALGLMNVNPQLIEAMVALSILFLAVELVRKARRQDGITQRFPWIIAFGFGLLHGAAFAGALSEIGLPEDNIPAALFLFNVGVEIGQLLFVLTVGLILFALRRLRFPDRAPGFARMAATYAIGSFSMYWFLERLGVAVKAIA